MIATLVLLAILTVASITDLRQRMVYNWLTYSGMLLALAANGSVSLWGPSAGVPDGGVWGWMGFPSSAAGLLICGFAMLVCYVFFPGGVGGGDVKLVAMIGAFLGPYAGIEAMLWAFVLGGCMAVVLLIWRFGAIRLLVRCGQLLWFKIRLGGPAPLSDQEREQLQTDVYLAPSALVAAVIVQWHVFVG